MANKILVLEKHGIVDPALCVRMADLHDLPVSIGAAVLLRETSGGHNVFGHDPTTAIPVRWQGSLVTHMKYRYYKVRRHHDNMQGVGPLQLTWWAFQDRADALGGCWVPAHNVSVGFHDLAAQIRAHGTHDGIKAYNGTGRDAEAYANHVIAVADVIHAELVK